MVSSAKLKSVDFYRKIPRDLTEASLSGAGLSIIAALSMMFLFGMELNDIQTSMISQDCGRWYSLKVRLENLRVDFNFSFPALSCEFASVDVSDVLGTVSDIGCKLLCSLVPLEQSKPSWEKAATIIREKYDPEMDGRILLAKVDCTEEVDLCRRNQYRDV
ncbi:hypothetical protein Leryth_027154 [Lithospermum erythrorhizon]|nr:hypothetical protein Leryth_027154 [Lithospermum erythrorhizon]